jgi:hypothetical protein
VQATCRVVVKKTPEYRFAEELSNFLNTQTQIDVEFLSIITAISAGVAVSDDALEGIAEVLSLQIERSVRLRQLAMERLIRQSERPDR